MPVTAREDRKQEHHHANIRLMRTAAALVTIGSDVQK